jgi:hypothetical protein
MNEDFTKEDVEKKTAGKKDRLSSSVASSTSSARPGAVRVGDTESNHDEWTL